MGSIAHLPPGSGCSFRRITLDASVGIPPTSGAQPHGSHVDGAEDDVLGRNPRRPFRLRAEGFDIGRRNR